MKFNKAQIGGLIILASVMVACTTAKITEPSACDSKAVAFPAPSIPSVPVNCSSVPSVTIPSVSTTTSLDLSDSIGKLKDVASSLQVAVNALTIDNTNGEFNWVGGVQVMVSTSNLPSKQLAIYTMPDGGASTELSPTITMSGADVYTYLSSGPVTLTLTLMGETVTACDAQQVLTDVADGGLSTSVNLCVSASGTVTKSL